MDPDHFREAQEVAGATPILAQARLDRARSAETLGRGDGTPLAFDAVMDPAHPSSPIPARPPPAGQLLEALLTTAHRIAVEMHNELSRYELSTMGLLALGLLVRSGDRKSTVRSLSARFGSTRSSTAELVDRLVRDGFVERVGDAYDRRSKVLRPTPDGVAAAATVSGALDRCMESCARSLSEVDKATLAALLNQLDRGADWHRTERMWNMHANSPRSRRQAIHVR
jgi:DNA-binding MarR family transcriptional regulator